MQERDSEYKSAGKFAWFAARDARMKSVVNASLFTESQKIKAERVKLALEMVYSCEDVTITNCKKWIRVKVHNGKVRDRRNLGLFEQDWTAAGITKMLTGQGIIYRVI
jgi:hypothetical protein